MKMIQLIAISAICLSGCVSTDQHSEFVQSVNFSPFDDFSYKHTLLSGSDLKLYQEKQLNELSEKVLCDELSQRSFNQVETDSDFYVVTKWRKSLTGYPDPFDNVEGFTKTYSRRDDPNYNLNTRWHLTVEIYQTATDTVFWRSELPNIFDATQFSETHIVESLKRAIKNFPKRVEKDPDLPNIG